eukprot:m.213513 g.213513  ORF g.213513 m.213513 type:complete len:270 (-) comp15523_c0_seq2:171-980(-)
MGRQKRCSATQKRQYWKESVQQYQNKFASTWKEYCHFDWEQCSDEPAGTEVIRNYIEDVIEAQPTLKGKFKVVDVKNQTLFDHLAIHGIVLDGKRASLSSQFPMNTTRSFALCAFSCAQQRLHGLTCFHCRWEGKTDKEDSYPTSFDQHIGEAICATVLNEHPVLTVCLDQCTGARIVRFETHQSGMPCAVVSDCSVIAALHETVEFLKKAVKEPGYLLPVDIPRRNSSTLLTVGTIWHLRRMRSRKCRRCAFVSCSCLTLGTKDTGKV